MFLSMKFKVKKQHRLNMYVEWGVHADRRLIAGFKLDLSVPDSNYKNQNLFIMFYFTLPLQYKTYSYKHKSCLK